MFRRQKKKKGILLIEGILMLALMTAVAFGMVSIMAGQFSTLSATKEANQAQQLAEYIASQLRQDGYENVEDFDMQESPKTADDFVGNSDLKGKYLYTVKKLSDFEAKGDSYNKVKLMEVKIYPTGYSNVPIYSLEVPLSSQAWAIPIGAVIAWPAEETPTSGGVWLECNGQTIPSQYKRLRELVGDKTPDYSGVFLRGLGSVTATYDQGLRQDRWNKTSTYSSGALGEIQGDAMRPVHHHTGQIFSLARSHVSRDESSADPDWTIGGRTPTYDISLPGSGGHSWYTWTDTPGYTGENGYESSGAATPDDWDSLTNYYLLTSPPKKYQLNGNNCSGGESCSGSSLSLSESDDEDIGFWTRAVITHWASYAELVYPYADEARPINKAVRYFIKAR